MSEAANAGRQAAIISLRRETSGDRDFLYELYSSTRSDELDAAGLTGELRNAFLETQFRAMCEAYRQQFAEADWWIVELNSVRVGRLIVSATAAEHRVVDLAVLPEFRGQGIGADLLRGVQRRARECGAPVRLQAFSDSRALALYRRLGFRKVGASGIRIQLEWT